MKQSTLSRKFVCLVLSLLLAAAVCSLTGCAKKDNVQTTTEPSGAVSTAPQNSAPENDTAVPTAVGEGETAFSFQVVFQDGSQKEYEVHTNSTIVGDALEQAGLISGEESSYGLFVKTVDGQTLDYDTDGKYWAFYIDGAYAATGVDVTQIADGSVYSFRAE